MTGLFIVAWVLWVIGLLGLFGRRNALSLWLSILMMIQAALMAWVSTAEEVFFPSVLALISVLCVPAIFGLALMVQWLIGKRRADVSTSNYFKN